MKTKKFQLTQAFLADILRHLARTSQLLQKKNSGIADAFQALDDLSRSVERMKTIDGPKLQQMKQKQSIGRHILSDHMERNACPFDQIKASMLNVLTESLANRFQDVSTTTLLAMRIANFSLWPAKNSPDWQTYGDEQIGIITTEYKEILADAAINTDAVIDEWPALRSEVERRYNSPASASWEDLNTARERFPNVLGVVDFILTLPSHSADCERGFSLMKRIKSDWRSSLNNDTLTDLMRIHLGTSAVEAFDPEPALRQWLASSERRRRPEINPYGQRVDAEESDSDSN